MTEKKFKSIEEMVAEGDPTVDCKDILEFAMQILLPTMGPSLLSAYAAGACDSLMTVQHSSKLTNKDSARIELMLGKWMAVMIKTSELMREESASELDELDDLDFDTVH
jgi:hypothetical protein